MQRGRERTRVFWSMSSFDHEAPLLACIYGPLALDMARLVCEGMELSNRPVLKIEAFGLSAFRAMLAGRSARDAIEIDTRVSDVHVLVVMSEKPVGCSWIADKVVSAGELECLYLGDPERLARRVFPSIQEYQREGLPGLLGPQYARKAEHA